MPCEHVMAIIERELGLVALQMERLRQHEAGSQGLRSRMTDTLASGSGTPFFSRRRRIRRGA